MNKNIKEVEGNVIEAPDEYSIDHCISQDFQMDKGIAFQFKRRFGQIEQFKSQKKQLTEIISIKKKIKNNNFFRNQRTLLAETVL